MTSVEGNHRADTVRRWVHPDDYDGAVAAAVAARKEVEKYKRRWKKAEQKLAEMERLYVQQYPELIDSET